MTKKEILEKLYNNRSWQLRVKFAESRTWWDVDLIYGLEGLDCKIGNLAENYYFRTEKRLNAERYSSFGRLINAIRRTAENRGLTLTEYRVVKGFPIEKENILEEAV